MCKQLIIVQMTNVNGLELIKIKYLEDKMEIALALICAVCLGIVVAWFLRLQNWFPSHTEEDAIKEYEYLKSMEYIDNIADLAKNGIIENLSIEKNRSKQIIDSRHDLYSILAGEFLEFEDEMTNPNISIDDAIYELKDVLACCALLLNQLYKDKKR